jgi:MFS transporter, NHS family, xanthosine permease
MKKEKIITLLTISNFLQFFVWGTWLISLGGYMYSNFKDLDGDAIGLSIGRTYGSMGWASLLMPALMGILADKYLSAQKVLGICHIIAGVIIYFATKASTSQEMYWTIFLTCCFYMPTIALCNAVSYTILEKNGLDIQKSFTPIRVFGTIGFIVAMWGTDLFGWKANANQFIFASAAMIFTGIYSFLLPDCPPKVSQGQKTLQQRLGLDALVLLKDRRMALFFMFSILLGAALQITNMFGETFIKSFGDIPEYKDSFGVQHSVLVISLSQISETAFILTIPFFLKKFGIKKVMLFSMLAWVLRFGLFGIGNPGTGLIFLLISMVVYGLAFDFFNISGSLFVERETDPKIRSSAQGLFMLATNGLGAILGGEFAGRVFGHFTEGKVTNWQNVWFTFAGYALIVAIVFAFSFKYKHNATEELNFKH